MQGSLWQPVLLSHIITLCLVALCCGNFPCSFVAVKRVTLKVMAFQHCIYTCFVCLCVGRKGIYRGMWNREGNQTSGLHSHCAANKNAARLEAAEVPADRETFLPFSCEPLRGPPRSIFLLYYAKCTQVYSVCKWWSGLPRAIKSGNRFALNLLLHLWRIHGKVCNFQDFFKIWARWSCLYAKQNGSSGTVPFDSPFQMGTKQQQFFFSPSKRWHPYKRSQERHKWTWKSKSKPFALWY